MHFSLRHLFVGLGLGLAVVACSSARDDADDDSSSDDLRVKPKGSENWSNLTIQLPTGTCQPGQSCTSPLGATATIAIDGANVALGAQTRLKPGDHTLVVNNVSTTVNLVAGKSRTITLPVAHRKCQAQGLPNVPQTDFGQSVSLSNAACPTTASVTVNGASAAPTVQLHWYNWNCPTDHIAGSLTPATKQSDCAALGTNQIYSISVNGQCVNLTSTSGIPPQTACSRYLAGDYSWTQQNVVNAAQFADTDRAFLPGTYAINVGGTTQTFTLAEGQQKEIPVNLAVVGNVPSTFSTNISFADSRELPDGQVATIGSSCSGDRSYAVPATTTTQLKLKAFVATSCTYTLSAGGRTQALDQTQTNSVTLHRVDVDNPEVTRENGSTYTVNGTYELFFGGSRVVGPLATNTGIDVLPGTYELVTKFTTADGPQVQHQTVQF